MQLASGTPPEKVRERSLSLPLGRRCGGRGWACLRPVLRPLLLPLLRPLLQTSGWTRGRAHGSSLPRWVLSVRNRILARAEGGLAPSRCSGRGRWFRGGRRGAGALCGRSGASGGGQAAKQSDFQSLIVRTRHGGDGARARRSSRCRLSSARGARRCTRRWRSRGRRRWTR